MKTLINSQRHTATERGIAGWTPLHYSARYGAEDVVKFLLSKGVGSEVDGKTTNQDTALHLAAEAGHGKIVRLLLDAKANPNAQDSRARTLEARCTSVDVQGMLAANSKSKSAGRTLSIPALQAQLNEYAHKVTQLTARNAILEKQAESATKEAAEIRDDMADKAPLKALLLTCSQFQDSSFPELPQIRSGRVSLRAALLANGYCAGNIIQVDDGSQQDMLQALVSMAKDQKCPAASTLLVYIGGHIHFDSLTKESLLVANDTARAHISSSALGLKTLAAELNRCNAKRKIM